MISSESIDRMGEFAGSLVGAGSNSSFWGNGNWDDVLRLSVDTLAMSVLAFAIAGIMAMLLLPLASSNLALDRTSGRRRQFRFVSFVITRAFFIFTRSVPELLWALIVVFVLSPGILAGAVALAIHNVGVIGRLGADTVEDASPAPIEAMRSAGANTVQIYLLGVLPLVSRQLITFQTYRWEVIIRTTAVVGFVAASGLGYQMRLDLSFFRYTNVGQLLVAYLLIVWTVDIISILTRRSIK